MDVVLSSKTRLPVVPGRGEAKAETAKEKLPHPSPLTRQNITSAGALTASPLLLLVVAEAWPGGWVRQGPVPQGADHNHMVLMWLAQSYPFTLK